MMELGIQLTVIWAHIGMSPKKPSYPGLLEILASYKASTSKRTETEEIINIVFSKKTVVASKNF